MAAEGGADELIVSNEHKLTRVSGVRAVRLASIVLAVLALAGCQAKHTQSGTAQGRPVIGAFRGKEENPLIQKSDKEQADRQEVVQLLIWQVTISNQEPKQAREFWKLFKPAQLSANNARLLEHNGLKIGAGHKQIWTKTLNKLDIGPEKPTLNAGKVRQIATRLAKEDMAEIALSTSPNSPTLFWHGANGELVGKTYENCQRLLVITAAALPRSRVQIKLTPALKDQSQRVRSLRKLALLAGQEPEKYVAKFEQLAFKALVNPDEFLIIGSGAQANEGAFGREFFDGTDQQPTRKTVLLVIPKVMSAEQVQ